jgi:adenine-specific DNA-methyltransferase
MNYIGSKFRLSSFINDTIQNVVGKNLSDKIFCDLFAGTGIVGRNFKTKVKQIISNDLEYYSYVLNKNYIGNNQFPINYLTFIEKLNNLKGKEGFIFNEYSENGKAGRNYFSEFNGKKIDAIRSKLENWQKNGIVNDNLFYFLLASLLESADKVANTASVYGAYLKHIKKTAQKELILTPALFETTKSNHKIYNEDSNVLIQKIKGDILYLDPPYNAREYGANYHLLNTIAKYDKFEPQGKTGLRQYTRSNYCKKNNVEQTFEVLIQNAAFKYIFLSYNNEGLMPPNTIESIMKKYGTYKLYTINYQRFKADKTENRNHKASKTFEYLHTLVKE